MVTTQWLLWRWNDSATYSKKKIASTPRRTARNTSIWYLRDQTWLCVYCWCETPEGVVSPRRSIPIITWCHHFSTAINILLIKGNSKFEPRATTVSVAMSPRYLGVKYRSRLHPTVAKTPVSVFEKDWACEIELRQTGVNCFAWWQRSWSCGVFKSWISNAHCPFQWKWQVLHIYDISVLQQVGMFFNGIACLVKVWPLFQREFPRVAMTWRSTRARISNVTSQT